MKSQPFFARYKLFILGIEHIRLSKNLNRIPRRLIHNREKQLDFLSVKVAIRYWQGLAQRIRSAYFEQLAYGKVERQRYKARLSIDN